eukprot:NODE_2021_length_849_cov_43.768750_g1419_i0.p3 GENE.NODE_2021_length_849_cov_43.768750_g1419_i0~~NODE_2021_length_849_cov_43.768750_g1419_i0.p3  ORF type:complete len:66 (+),score=1.23 NODE_2021_length_849_cov_43.768750_g1419_i0:478-675(+)
MVMCPTRKSSSQSRNKTNDPKKHIGGGNKDVIFFSRRMEGKSNFTFGPSSAAVVVAAESARKGEV